MFERLLIANRGEIACRIIRTARRMGIATVAVYSEADAEALHVRMADEAVAIGPAPAAESYLRGERIIEAALATGAEAIHPGYGFLAENPDFAEAVEAAGLVWVGPPPDAIRAMGLKDAAKRLMEAAGVPVTPGYHGEEQDAAFLFERAQEIGFPLLIKARAGGGGKGMRRVERAEDFAEALARARSEAEASFGDGAVILERWIENPRHIEVQVFADSRGNTVHLYERDCSAQRRHQKVIEEAPAPGVSPAVRAEITAAAVRAAEAVGYRNAGTVEFIAEGGAEVRSGGFWFMEMNTRLQVEHPVTEAITGLDLVEWQLRIAAGEPLPLAQEEIPLAGHAVEARLYAEDPAEGFAPRTGRLQRLALPEGLARVDSGVAEGDAVTPHYDPMIAKIIAHGPGRAVALRRLSEALAATHVEGVTTNLAFLGRFLAEEDFRAGRLDTHLIDRRLAALTAPAEASGTDLALAAGALAGLLEPAPLAGWRGWGPGRSHVGLVRAEGVGEETCLALRREGDRLVAETPAGEVRLGLRRVEGALWELREGGRVRRVWVHEGAGTVTIARDGARLVFRLADPVAAHEAEEEGADAVTAPLPGIVKALHVAPGAEVAAGDPLAVMEAMKMEHTLRAPRDGRIAEVAVAAGQQVEEGALIAALEPAAEGGDG